MTPEQASRLAAELKQVQEADADADEMRRDEDAILNIFVDLWSLFRRKPLAAHQTGGEAPSTEAYLFSYLRALDSDGEDLPPDFLQALQRAVAHYGITSLERSPELEECLLWIYKSHQKVEQQIAPILAVLQRRLAQLNGNLAWADEAFHTLLDRMVSITRELFPGVNDLARELRYRCFEQPFFEQARRRVYADMEEHLDYLAAHPDALDLQQKVRTLVECPQPLASLLAGRFPTASLALRQTMMQIVTSRYYRRRLTNFRTLSIDGHCFARLNTTKMTSTSTSSWLMQSTAGLRKPSTLSPRSSPRRRKATALCSISLPGNRTRFPTPSKRRARSTRSSIRLSSLVRFIAWLWPLPAPTASRAWAGYNTSLTNIQTAGYQEVQLFRGVHPMMGERLHLWRLKNFKIDRLPSVEDVYLLHAVANENPKDERLFAVAEVRDLTPVRDKRHRIVQLPHLERMFSEAVAAIRQYQMKRSARERLYWNRIFLYVWPTLNLKPDEVKEIVHRLAPMADGLGLEQVVVRIRIPNARTGELRDSLMRISAPGDAGLLMTFRPAGKSQPLKPLTSLRAEGCEDAATRAALPV